MPPQYNETNDIIPYVLFMGVSFTIELPEDVFSQSTIRHWDLLMLPQYNGKNYLIPYVPFIGDNSTI